MIAWLDVETTGLVPELDYLLEVGILLTDDDLNEIGHTSAVIGCNVDSPLLQARLDLGGGFVRDMHTRNGLLADVRHAHGHGVALPDIENYLINWMSNRTGSGDKPVMGGNSVTLDREFLRVFTPGLLEMFHYRSIDVSSVRELARRWRPDLTNQEPVRSSTSTHRVLDDLRDSLTLARFYRHHLFTPINQEVPL